MGLVDDHAGPQQVAVRLLIVLYLFKKRRSDRLPQADVLDVMKGKVAEDAGLHITL
jgi:hypothetical protein